jgi:hypothetical protein
MYETSASHTPRPTADLLRLGHTRLGRVACPNQAVARESPNSLVEPDAVEDEDALAPVKAIAIGVLLAIPLWSAIGVLVWLIAR